MLGTNEKEREEGRKGRKGGNERGREEGKVGEKKKKRKSSKIIGL